MSTHNLNSTTSEVGLIPRLESKNNKSSYELKANAHQQTTFESLQGSDFNYYNPKQQLATCQDDFIYQ